MFSYYPYLKHLNEDIYGVNVQATTKEELINKMINALESEEYDFEEYYFDKEDDSFDEVKEKYNIVEGLIEKWDGPGEYCMVRSDTDSIDSTKFLLDCELECMTFPITIKHEFFENPSNFMKKWKVDENIKYAYIITNLEGKASHLVLSNDKHDKIVSDLYYEKGMYNLSSSPASLDGAYWGVEVEEMDQYDVLDALAPYDYQYEEINYDELDNVAFTE